MLTDGRSRLSKLPITKSGTVSPRGREGHSFTLSYLFPVCWEDRRLPTSPLQTGIAGVPSPEWLNLIFSCAPTSRAFHLATVSNTLFPSDRFADSVATGYQATYPIPRTAVKVLLIRSQSLCAATGTGTPIRASRVASSWMTPSYPISNSTEAFGGTSLGKVTSASETAPV